MDGFKVGDVVYVAHVTDDSVWVDEGWVHRIHSGTGEMYPVMELFRVRGGLVSIAAAQVYRTSVDALRAAHESASARARILEDCAREARDRADMIAERLARETADPR